MSNLYQHQSSNIWKTRLLIFLFLIIVIGFSWFTSYYYEQPWILYTAIIFAVSNSVTSYWFSDKIALSVNRAKKAKRERYKDLLNLVENLAISSGIQAPRVYIIEDSAPNAFATGRDEKHGAIAVTTGLLSILERSELEGVIAHELAHIKNKDILLSTVVFVLVGVMVLISDITLRITIFGGRSNSKSNNSVMMAVSLIAIIFAAAISPIIQLAISRKREFLADSTGALMTRYPEGLASALKKISSYPTKMKYANNATAHMFIANPFGSRKNKKQSFISKLYLTHPPVEERIDKLLSHNLK